LVDSGADRVVFEADSSVPLAVPAGGIAPAVLFVDKVTDAVKDVDGGRVVGSRDRDGLWQVGRIELDRELVISLPSGSLDLGGVVEGVRSAGYTWRVVEVSPSAP
jgi:hypothetical protein